MPRAALKDAPEGSLHQGTPCHVDAPAATTSPKRSSDNPNTLTSLYRTITVKCRFDFYYLPHQPQRSLQVDSTYLWCDQTPPKSNSQFF